MKKFNSINECIDYYLNHQVTKSFYPTAIIKQVDNVTIEELYDILTQYVNKNKLSVLYEVRCPNCSEIIGTYEYYGDIPTSFEYCPKCENDDIEKDKNICILYKIIR